MGDNKGDGDRCGACSLTQAQGATKEAPELRAVCVGLLLFNHIVKGNHMADLFISEQVYNEIIRPLETEKNLRRTRRFENPRCAWDRVVHGSFPRFASFNPSSITVGKTNKN